MADYTGTLSSEEIKTRVSTSYNAIATRYLAWAGLNRETTHRYLEQLAPYLRSGDRVDVLELGCGAGIPSTKYLTSIDAVHVTANDISSTQLTLARKMCEEGRVRLIEGDMMKLACSNESFDAIIALYSIFHLPNHEQAEMVKKVEGWLKPGGRFLCCFNIQQGEHIQSQWLGEWMYWSGCSADESLAMVTQAGFRIESSDVIFDEEMETEEAKGDEYGKRRVPFLWVMASKT